MKNNFRYERIETQGTALFILHYNNFRVAVIEGFNVDLKDIRSRDEKTHDEALHEISKMTGKESIEELKCFDVKSTITPDEFHIDFGYFSNFEEAKEWVETNFLESLKQING